MSDAFVLLLGALLGALTSVLVQLALRELDRRRQQKLSARVLFGEFAEYASAMINSEDGAYDAASLHVAWKEHRAGLVDIGGEDWQCVETAVMRVVYPDHFPPEPPSSAPLPDQVEVAFGVLESHSDLPKVLRSSE